MTIPPVPLWALIPCAGALLWFSLRVLAWLSGVWGRETPLRMDHPFPMAGRADMVRWERNLSLTVVELKTRRKVYAARSDVIQLSCYAAMLRRKSMWRVNPKGVVIVQTPDGHRSEIVVDLVGEDELSRLYERRLALASGRALPGKAPSKALCQSCAWRGNGCQGR